MTTILIKPQAPVTETVEPDDVAHFIWGDDPKATITEAIVTGKPIVALCGKVFVPSRDISNLPICKECKKRKEEIQKNANRHNN